MCAKLTHQYSITKSYDYIFAPQKFLTSAPYSALLHILNSKPSLFISTVPLKYFYSFTLSLSLSLSFSLQASLSHNQFPPHSKFLNHQIEFELDRFATHLPLQSL